MHKVWMTVPAWVCPNLEAYNAILEQEGKCIDAYAYHLLDKRGYTRVVDAAPVDLVELTPREMGFRARTRRIDMFRRGVARDFELLSRARALSLRRHYDTQPIRLRRILAMETMAGRDRRPHTLALEYRENDRPSLTAVPVTAQCYLDLDEAVVFVQPRR